MAHMYPNTFPADSKSSGERKVFEYLKANAPKDWYVLHSFRLPQHRKVVFGEADFVVLAPQLGIFVLEIKSGGVGFDGTNWMFMNRDHEISYKQRGPFQQAREAMFEIERIIKSRLGDQYGRTEIMYGYGVVFTDESHFPTSSIIEDEVWRLYQRVDNPNYCDFIRSLCTNFTKELKILNKDLPSDFTSTDAEHVAKTLRPIVDCVTPLKRFMQHSEEDIIALTEEQYTCLDDIEINDRVVVTGGAGTGKTLIAIEEAKRDIEEGKNVAVFCYNKNLAEFIRTNLTKSNVDVYSIHSFMVKLCGCDISAIKTNEDFYNKELPELATVAAQEHHVIYDKIIVDEFQDLCTIPYLKFFETILINGLLDGKFTFYGDFARQAIYDEESKLGNLEKFTYFTKKRLSLNCRNTLNIGNELVNIIGYSDKSYKLKVKGEPVDYFVCATENEQKDKLLECIKRLERDNIKAPSIIILSPKRRENSIVFVLDPNKILIGDYGEDAEAYHALFSTIQSFKGLESEVVILVDIENYSNPQLMYVALSRARSKMIVIESDKASTQRKKLTIKR